MIQSNTIHSTNVYLYQRNGIYYFRLKNRHKMISLSLHTRDRRTAMSHSRQIKAALKAIHADNPDMTYENMREHLREIAEWELSTKRSDLFQTDMRDLYKDQYAELGQHLSDAVASEPLTIDQHRYIEEAMGVLKACIARIEGNAKPLLDYIDNDSHLSVSDQQSVFPSTSNPVDLSDLIEQYERENIQNWKPATLSENRASHSTLIEIFNHLGLNDLTKTTRADMIAVRDVLQQIPKNRKQRFKDAPLSDLLARPEKSDCMDVVTINNKYLVKMSAVFKWAVRNGFIERNLTEGLELKAPSRKASDARKAFSVAQVGQLIDAAKKYAEKPSGKPYHYFVPVIAAITGARLNEVAQLQVSDIKTTDNGTVYIHINESGLDGKSIKNPHSERFVPLVDGAYGFVLADFMSLVKDRRGASGGDSAMVFDGLRLMKNGYGEQVSKWFNRTLLPKVIAEREGLAFHSFRHTVATQLKQKGVELAYAQAVLGHSSGSITYDRYAKDVEVDTLLAILNSSFN
ncbi:site-specific integrase [Citrobacter portucalensis]|uniref:site-specific integrase n=1 Tax=Citrobacter portucalensis TaxID=1639133 RepID=UPI00226B9460|nr:site-specific integrase [Citrobacter portucalensis]MCX9070651.1 site-specific integrase [Citrobacter portucalensis]